MIGVLGLLRSLSDGNEINCRTHLFEEAAADEDTESKAWTSVALMGTIVVVFVKKSHLFRKCELTKHVDALYHRSFGLKGKVKAVRLNNDSQAPPASMSILGGPTILHRVSEYKHLCVRSIKC